MASSSRPFESQTVSRLMAGYRNLQHGAKKRFLKGKLALLWGVQVAVFPAYVAFQSIRTGYRRLQSKHPWQALKGLLTGQPVQELPVTADTPIRTLLSAIQPQVAPKGGWLRPVNYHGAFLRQSHAGGVLTNGAWHLVPVKEPIRGVASNLATRQLVLVTVGNSIFEGLTEDQQNRLETAIALLLAEYGATLKQRQWDRNLTQPGLPLPKSEPTQWPIVRWFYQGMRWMQTGGLAAVTNLFGEADQNQRFQMIEGQGRFWRTPLPTTPVPLPIGEAPEWLQPQSLEPSDVDGRHPQAEVTHWATEGPADSITLVDVVPSTEDGQSSSIEFMAPDRADAYWPSEIDAVEARVSQASYIDNWFVQLLRWVDQALLWLERSAGYLWNWLRRQR